MRQGKGRKDRYTTLPASLRAAMHEHLEAVRVLHRHDLQDREGLAPLPYALARKLGPAISTDWSWQWAQPRTAPPRIDPLDFTG